MLKVKKTCLTKHFFVEIDHEILFMVIFSLQWIDHEILSIAILSLLRIQEGQLSVSGERMCSGTG